DPLVDVNRPFEEQRSTILATQRRHYLLGDQRRRPPPRGQFAQSHLRAARQPRGFGTAGGDAGRSLQRTGAGERAAGRRPRGQPPGLQAREEDRFQPPDQQLHDRGRTPPRAGGVAGRDAEAAPPPHIPLSWSSKCASSSSKTTATSPQTSATTSRTVAIRSISPPMA